MDLAAGARIFGHDPRTLYRWLERSAQHAQRVHNHFFKNLVCAHVQLDELVGNLRGKAERVFIWVAIEAQTKIVPVLHLGRRTNADAQRVVHELWQRLTKKCLPIFTTDGLRVLCGTRARLAEALQALGLSDRIMTAYIERFNLTVREHVAPLARRTLALAQDEHLLWMHLEWFRAYYHFSLYHEALRFHPASSGRFRSRTPDMAAGIARRRWRVKDLLLTPIPAA